MIHRHSVSSAGFTIVELLVVVVVIAILASITISAYNGITGRAYDSSVQSDLQNMGEMVSLAGDATSTYPIDEATLSVVGLRVSKNAYGNEIVSGGVKYNVLYCSTKPPYQPAGFAFVSASKSGNVFAFRNSTGAVTTYPTANWAIGWGSICPDVLGVASGNSNVGIWLYENSIWKIWLTS